MSRRDAVLLDAARALAHALSNAALIVEINGSPQVKGPLLRAHNLARLLVAGLGGAVKPRSTTLAAWREEWRELVVEPHKGGWTLPALDVPDGAAKDVFTEIPGSLTLALQDLSTQGPLTVVAAAGPRLKLIGAAGFDWSFVKELAAKNGWGLALGAESALELAR